MTDEIRANNNETEELSGEKLNEILRIRRDKLAALQAEIPNAAQIGYVTELHENYLILE